MDKLGFQFILQVFFYCDKLTLLKNVFKNFSYSKLEKVSIIILALWYFYCYNYRFSFKLKFYFLVFKQVMRRLFALA